MKYQPPGDGELGSRPVATPRPLVDPPVSHPGLTKITVTIRTFRNQMLGHVIAGLRASPRLWAFSLAFDVWQPSTDLAGLVLELRHISSRTEDTKLDLTCWSDQEQRDGTCFWAASEEACDVARSLNCVRWINVTCWSLDLCARTLLWLALLPALLRLHFTIYTFSTNRESTEALAKFLDQARAALPHMPQVDGHLC